LAVYAVTYLIPFVVCYGRKERTSYGE
jgi:hypothetical protein